MKTDSDSKSSWKTVVIIPAIAIIVGGISTALSDDLRNYIKNIFSKNTSADKTILQLVLTNNNAALRRDTVIFDNGAPMLTDDGGKCFEQLDPGQHQFKVYAFNRTFQYSFLTPNKPDSVYTLSEDLGYTAPVSPPVVTSIDTSHKNPTPSTGTTGTTGSTGSAVSTGALAAKAQYLPNAMRKIQVSKLAVYMGHK
jgi:hypothetical protein